MESKALEDAKELQDQTLDMEKLKYCLECGICTASCPVMEITSNRYNPRILLEQIILEPDQATKEETLWLCAWCYKCHKRCPQRLKVPEIFLAIRKVAREQGHQEKFNDAIKTVAKYVPFPAAYCWVCLHPERAMLDRQFVEDAIRNATSFYAKKKKRKAISTQESDKHKVAVIGSGPAGLTAAHELSEKGFPVTVFEAMPKLGGMLQKCLPTYRLPKDVLPAEIEHMKDSGIEFRTNTPIGKDLTIEKLRQGGFASIFIAAGAHRSRELDVEGCNLEGVTYALEFLKEANFGKARVGQKVIVIGGGNVAVDAARTAHRIGAREVVIVYRRSREEMPADPWEILEAENDCVKTQFLVSPKRILGQNGRVKALECIKMTLGEPDDTGRRSPVPVENSEFIVETDMVLLAVGEKPDLTFLPTNIQITKAGTIAVDPFTMETSMPGVFAGGDVVSGPATVVEAIVAGKRAASSIERYIKGENS
ncbi:FAD-dependent oxidoreductase [Candidatus Bathyarchaeota archaeon]|nr:FAD-dependent oxidoreductase [Candidatus Bathyarchaeota archaeon]